MVNNSTQIAGGKPVGKLCLVVVWFVLYCPQQYEYLSGLARTRRVPYSITLGDGFLPLVGMHLLSGLYIPRGICFLQFFVVFPVYQVFYITF